MAGDNADDVDDVDDERLRALLADMSEVQRNYVEGYGNVHALRHSSLFTDNDVTVGRVLVDMALTFIAVAYEVARFELGAEHDRYLEPANRLYDAATIALGTGGVSSLREALLFYEFTRREIDTDL